MGIERNDWPKARELLDAANEATYPVAAICTFAESERHVQVMLDPPADLACKPAALTGLAIGLEDLANVVPGADAVRRFIAPALDAAGPFDPKAASEAAIVAFSRRKKYHYQYLASLHLGLHAKLASPKARAAAFPLSKIIGVWAVRLRLDGWRPSKHTIARVIAARRMLPRASSSDCLPTFVQTGANAPLSKFNVDARRPYPRSQSM